MIEHAYRDWSRETHRVEIKITSSHLVWETEVPPEFFQAAFRSATITRGRWTWRVEVWLGEPNQVILGDYPMSGDVVTLNWA